VQDDKPLIAAGGVFSDSWDVIPIVIGNLILGGVKDFFFILHNSDSDLTVELQELFSDSANIHFLLKPSEPFFQGTMMTFLANWARWEGFDIFIPIDSDEFLLSESSEYKVVDFLKKWYQNEDSLALKVPLMNYVQSKDVYDFNSKTALNSNYLAVARSEAMSETKEAVFSGGSIVNKGTETKVVVKLTPNSSLEISEGSHYITSGGDLMEGDSQGNLFIAHLPYRSRNSMIVKVRGGQNLIRAQFQEDTGWQNQMLVGFNEDELDEIWSRNSFERGLDGSVRLAKGSDQLEFDERLALAIKNVLHTFDYEHWMLLVDQTKNDEHTKFQLGVDVSLIFDVFGKHMRELKSSYAFKSHTAVAERDRAVAERDRAVTERDRAVAERDRAVAERDRAVAERDRAVAERDRVFDSMIWKITKPYRKLRSLF
jgi:hypothetical protein